MKKLFFLGACLVALASQPVAGQTGGADVVVVRVDESNAKKVRVVVSYGNGKTEVSLIEGAYNVEGSQAIVEGYQRVFQKLYHEGYSLKNSFTGTYNATQSFVFVKGQ